MRKAVLLMITFLLALSLVSFAQDKKQPDRVSGTVAMIDAKAGSIEVSLSTTPTARRTVLWDSSTKVQVVDKAGTPADIKEGMRIVAIGKFDGVKLRATDIRVRPQ